MTDAISPPTYHRRPEVSGDGATPRFNFEVPSLEGTEDWYTLANPQNARLLAFWKTATGLEDEDELKEHLLQLRERAYRFCPYPCVRSFRFLQPELSSLPAYRKVLEVGRTASQPILLDLGCFVGLDLRKAVADGYPSDAVVGLDIMPEPPSLSSALFRNDVDAERGRIPIICGDILPSSMLSTDAPVRSQSDKPIDLSSLSSLEALRGRVTVICANLFFHCFDEHHEREVMERCKGLLDTKRAGSMIFGWHVGARTKGIRSSPIGSVDTLFVHSPASWTELAQEVFGGSDKVDVEAELKHFNFPGVLDDVEFLVWTVTLK